MDALSADESVRVQAAIYSYFEILGASRMTIRVRRNFKDYAAIRHDHGDVHLNQAFDPVFTQFQPDDFWVMAQNAIGEPIATYCVRRLIVDDFYDLIRSQALWFGVPRSSARPFVVRCAIQPLGGAMAHAGGLWVRKDYRGAARQPRLSTIMSRIACAIALRNKPFDHDTAMIRIHPLDPPGVADRKAVCLGVKTYGFARVERFVHGWFPPDGRTALMHLCHSTRAEAIASLVAPSSSVAARSAADLKLRQPPLIYQHNELVNLTTVGSDRQQQARVGQ